MTTKLKHAPEIVAQHAVTPMQMLQIAVEKNADLDQMQKLMDLQERWEANQAKKAFTKALNAFKSDPPTLIKDKKVDFSTARGRTAYDYLTLAQAANVISERLSKFGLSHRWDVSQNEGRVSVTCILSHEDGHSEQVTLQGPMDESGSKNPIQAIGSTVTYLERYTLLAITGLAAAGQDDDGRAVDQTMISEKQKAELVALQEKAKADTKKFLVYLGKLVDPNGPPLGHIGLLPAVKFDSAKASLESKIAQNAKAGA